MCYSWRLCVQKAQKVINVPWWDRSRPSSTHYVYKVIGEGFSSSCFTTLYWCSNCWDIFFFEFFLYRKMVGYMVGRVLFRFGQLYLSKVFPHVLHYLFNVFVWWRYFFFVRKLFITKGVMLVSYCRSNINDSKLPEIWINTFDFGIPFSVLKIIA